MRADRRRRAPRDDIDGLSTYPGGGGAATGHSEGGITAVENALRVRPTWISGGPETPGPVRVDRQRDARGGRPASAGTCCASAPCGSRPTRSSSAKGVPGSGGGRIGGDMQWRIPYGALSAANWIGMNASLHMHRYGTTRESLGWIALNAPRERGAQPRGHLPRTAHDGRLPRRRA